jgi:hypothetical protein
MWRWLLPVAVACVAAYVLVQTSQHTLRVPPKNTGTAPLQIGFEHPCLERAHRPTTYKHVIWIVLGSRKYSDVIGKHTKATYVNQLAKDCGLATQYYSVTHPGLPDLVASVSGTTAGFTKNSCDGCHTSVPSLFKQVPSWGVYIQSMPSNCRTSDATGGYVARMNPAAYFTKVGCPARDRPLGSTSDGPLAKALDSGTLPRLSVIVPDECHSMSFSHGCGSTKLGVFVALGDQWLQGWMKRLLASKEYTSGQTAIFVTWVDGTPGNPRGVNCVKTHLPSCHVATLVVAPYVKPGTEIQTPFTHYSRLRTTETLLGVPRRLGAARGAPGMRVPFGL